MKYRKTISVTLHYDIQASTKKDLGMAEYIAQYASLDGHSDKAPCGSYSFEKAVSPPAPPVPRWKRLKKDDIIQITDLKFSKDNPGFLEFADNRDVGLKAGSYNHSGFYRLVTANQD